MIRSYKIILLLFFTIAINTQVHASQTSYEPAYLGKEDAVKLKDATNSKNTKSQQTSEKDFSEKLIDDADKVKNTENTDTESLTIEEKNYPDPYENYNRSMHSINKFIDKYAIKPVAQLYTFLVPLPIKRMVTNFFSNIQDLNVLINYILQGEVENSAETVGRFSLNSTFGIFGLLDVANDVGWPKRNNDYGITFGKWGAADSSYFVIPIFGPSTFRDAFGRGIGVIASPVYFLEPEYSIPYFGLYMVDTRANLLTAEKIVDTVSDDEYVFIRNSYLEYRDSLIRGEKPDILREENEESLMRDILSLESTTEHADNKNNKDNNTK